MKPPLFLKSSCLVLAIGLANAALANETLVYQITSGSDDAEESLSTNPSEVGAIDLGSSDIEIGSEEYGSVESKQLVGLRFTGIQLPKNTQILKAYIQFTTDETKSKKNVNPFSINISAEASDNAATYKEAAYNISSRLEGGEVVEWSNDTTWDKEHDRSAAQRTSDISKLVQEIVNRDGWQQGNAIAFMLKGEGTRAAESFEGSAKHLDGLNDYAAQLVIEVPSKVAYQIDASDNDAEENLPTGEMDVGSSDLELGWEKNKASEAQAIGLRYTGVNIPKGAKILSASIQFAQDEAKNNNPFALTIWGEASGNTKAYNNDVKNISSRNKTKASVSWQNVNDWLTKHEQGADQLTPDLTALIQEIVNRDDWSEGNSLGFIMEGIGTRTAESFDGTSNLAPILNIEFIGESKAPSVEKVRLAWNQDPSSTMTIIWNQLRGTNAKVYFDKYEGSCSNNTADYRQQLAPQRTTQAFGMNNSVARLTSLEANTSYRFLIADTANQSECMWFKTAPNTPQAFTYITGGDTKSSGNALQAGRWTNSLVGKLRPLFVMFTGDFNSGNGLNAASWKQWLNDWSTQTKSSDGRMYPIVTVHGNHEDGDFEVLYKLFDSGNPDSNQSANYAYNVLSFGGNLLRVYNLNSQLYRNGLIDAHNKQNLWFEQDLIKSQDYTFRVAGYHKPMRPHTKSKSENDYLVADWAPLYDKYDINIAYESDTHNHVITFPIRLAEAGENGDMEFIRDDSKGTLHIGEGSWGATPRDNNDDKSWTLDSASFNQLKLNHVYPAQGKTKARIEIRSIKSAEYVNGKFVNFAEGVAENTEANSLAIPEGAAVRNIPFYGKFITYPFVAVDGDAPATPINLSGQATSYFDISINWENTAEEGTVRSIQLERKLGENGEWTLINGALPSDTTRYTDKNLKDGSDYYYRVRVTNVFGASDWTMETKISTPIDPRVKLQIQEGVDGYTGNNVLAIASASPTKNFVAKELSIDLSTNDFGGSGMSHGLIKFANALAQLPINAVIDSAQVRIWVTSSSNGPVALHRVLQEWTTTDASWNLFSSGIQADDVEAKAVADDSLADIGSNYFIFFDVTSSIKAWAVGEPNYGWAILNSSTDGWDLATELFDREDRRPQLTIFYSLKGDVNKDGKVDRKDMLELRKHLRQSAEVCTSCDLNSDGQINVQDMRKLAILLRQ